MWSATFLCILAGCFWIKEGSANGCQASDVYLGCFEDRAERALPHASTNSDSMTISTCINHCGTRGYLFAGLQFARWCFCGNDGYAQYSSRPDNDCASDCAGDSSTYCGGTYRNAVYRTAYLRTVRVGCFKDTGVRALPHAFVKNNSIMSVNYCVRHCHDAGYRYAGLQYSQECFCGDDQYARYGQSPDSECNATCPGDSSSTCGGTFRNEVYMIAF